MCFEWSEFSVCLTLVTPIHCIKKENIGDSILVTTGSTRTLWILPMMLMTYDVTAHFAKLSSIFYIKNIVLVLLSPVYGALISAPFKTSGLHLL